MTEYRLSQAVEAGGLVFVSGQTAFPDVDGDLADQLRRAYAKVAALVPVAQVVDETIYVVDDDWRSVATVRAEVYGDGAVPASTLVRVAGFPDPRIRCEVKVVARA